MTSHKCFTSDGMEILCFCARGIDHNEAEYDIPVGELTGEAE